MSDKPRYSVPVLKAKPKADGPQVIAALDAAGERAGFNARDPEPLERPKRGRPSKGRDKSDPRPSFSLDPETHQLFKIWLLREGISMQDYLEEHIKGLVRE